MCTLSTHGDPSEGMLQPAELDDIFTTYIANELDEDCERQSDPLVVFIVGQPGAGKTAAQFDILRSLEQSHVGLTPDEIAVIDADVYRKYHPKWDEYCRVDDRTAALNTHFAASYWVNQAISHVTHKKYNAIVSATFKNPDNAMAKIRGFKRNGYHVTVAFMAVHEAVSHFSTIYRYHDRRRKFGWGRWVPAHIHDVAYARLPEVARSIEGLTVGSVLVDELLVYRRDLSTPVYRHNSSGRLPANLRLDQIISRERLRTWRTGELLSFGSSVQNMSAHLSHLQATLIEDQESLARIVGCLLNGEACFPKCGRKSTEQSFAT